VIVEVVGAVIRDAGGQLLTVRKRGTQRFMLPGGKREPGEDDLAEIEEMLWIDPAAPPPVPIAPLLVAKILPALIAAH
jgi:8-oxo-dGTP pyrophosphatase MutT (NUDIX family)